MAGEFVIYTLGENSLFMGALNGVAMLFKNSDLFYGNGLGNVGMGAVFGFFMLFVVWIYNAAFKQQLDMRMLLAPLVLYMILTVPKTNVLIQDVKSGNISKVDNVPLGLALPASVMSGIAVSLTHIFEKGYQVVSDSFPNGYMPKISEDGYVTPLKLINGLRDAASIVPSQTLLATTKNIYMNCIAENPAFSQDEYVKSANPVEYFAKAAITSGSNVVPVKYMSSNGTAIDTISTCREAGQELLDALEAYTMGMNKSQGQAGQVNKIIGDVTKNNLRNAVLQQIVSKGQTGGFQPKPSGVNDTYTDQDLMNAVGNMSKVGQQDATNFMMATVFNPLLETSSYCYGKSATQADMSKCSAWISSKSQWEEKNAASATGFLQVMQDGQNVFIMFSFLIFPMMVLFIMIQGVSSFKIIGNYLAFTMAAYLWLPMASVINFYIQSALATEWEALVTALGGTPLNLMTAPQFYGAVSQKLALANALLASVPILCIMMFTGMMMGMNQLYSRMNSADAGGYDAKVNSPDLAKTAPIASTTSAVNVSGTGVATASGFMTSGISASSTTMSATEIAKNWQQNLSQARSDIDALQQAISKSQSRTTGDSVTTGQGETRATTAVTTDSQTNTKGTSTGESATDNRSVGLNKNQTNSQIGAVAVAGGAGVNAGVNGGFTKQGEDKNGANANGKPARGVLQGQVQAGVSANAGANAASTISTANGVALDNSQLAQKAETKANNTSNSQDNTKSNSDTYTVSQLESKLHELKSQAVDSKTGTISAQNQALISKAESSIKSVKQSESLANQFAVNVTGKEGELASSLRLKGQNVEQLEQLGNQLGGESFKNNQNIIDDNMRARLPNQEDRRAVAIWQAAAASGNDQLRNQAWSLISPTMAEKSNDVQENLKGVGDTPRINEGLLTAQLNAGTQRIQAAHEAAGSNINQMTPKETAQTGANATTPVNQNVKTVNPPTTKVPENRPSPQAVITAAQTFNQNARNVEEQVSPIVKPPK